VRDRDALETTATSASRARGKYVCCLDADDLLERTYLEKAIFHLETGEFDIVCGGLRNFGGADGILVNRPRPTADDFRKTNCTFVNAVFRRKHWREAGGYRDSDPKTTSYVYEDWVYWARLTRMGARVLNMREPLLLYRRHAASLSVLEGTHPPDVQQRLINQVISAIVDSRKLALSSARPVRPFRYVPEDGRPGAMLAMTRGADLTSAIRPLAASGWRVIAVLDWDDGEAGHSVDQRLEAMGALVYRLPRFVEPGLWQDFIRFLITGQAVNAVIAEPGTFVEQAKPYLEKEFSRVVFQTIDETFDLTKVTVACFEGDMAPRRRSLPSVPVSRRYEAEVRRLIVTELQHAIGEPDGTGGWASQGHAGVMTYGPYVDLPSGEYKVCVAFSLMARLGPTDRIIVDVVDRGAARELAKATFTAHDELLVGEPRQAAFAISCPDGAFGLELRIKLFGAPSIRHGDVVVTQTILLPAT